MDAPRLDAMTTQWSKFQRSLRLVGQTPHRGSGVQIWQWNSKGYKISTTLAPEASPGVRRQFSNFRKTKTGQRPGGVGRLTEKGTQYST